MSERLAILFVDMADSTGLYQRLGDAAAAALNIRLLEDLRRRVAEHGGRVVKLLGDGLLATFPQASASVLAAEAMMVLQPVHGLGIRVAIHLGEVVVEPMDIFGDAVNLAARIEARGRPGEILVSDDLVQALPEHLRAGARPFDEVIVKGRSSTTRVWRMERSAAAEHTMLPATLIQRAAPTMLLALSWGGQRLDLRAGQKAVLGRAPDCDLVLASPYCSRSHALLAHLGDRFTLADQSSNGTFVMPEIGGPMLVRRETVTLAGRGLIGLGLGPEEDLGQVVGYAVAAG